MCDLAGFIVITHTPSRVLNTLKSVTGFSYPLLVQPVVRKGPVVNNKITLGAFTRVVCPPNGVNNTPLIARYGTPVGSLVSGHMLEVTPSPLVRSLSTTVMGLNPGQGLSTTLPMDISGTVKAQ